LIVLFVTLRSQSKIQLIAYVSGCIEGKLSSGNDSVKGTLGGFKG